MDKELLIEVINKNLPSGAVILEEPTLCVLVHRDFVERPTGYSVKFSINGFERVLFICSHHRPKLHSAGSLFDRTIPELKDRCYFAMASRCKRVFVV